MTTADRSRRFGTWAAAVARPPVATPPTVGWQRPPRFSEVARRELGELLQAGQEVLAERLAELGRNDPARRHLKRIRRLRRKVRAEAGVAAGLAALAAAAVVAPGPEITEYGLGAGAALVGWQAVRAGQRLRRLRQQPVPPPRAGRPPRDSPAREPLDRLAEHEQALHGLLVHLGSAADEPRRVAATAAAGLRQLGTRLTAVDRAHRLSGGLDEAVDALRRQLHDGLASYEALVVAAADAVAADAGLRGPALLQEATDALAGLAAGLRAVG